MVQVEILPSLLDEIYKKFKGESSTVLNYLWTLEKSPNKGKLLLHVKGLSIKELKYKGFRFYFVTEGYQLRLYSQGELVDVLLRFVRMSDKKRQQETIEEIRKILLHIGPYGFE